MDSAESGICSVADLCEHRAFHDQLKIITFQRMEFNYDSLLCHNKPGFYASPMRPEVSLHYRDTKNYLSNEQLNLLLLLSLHVNKHELN
jgi:hypothetical protein